MIKLNFVAGRGERTLIASGEHFRGTRYKRYKVTGHWDPSSEGGKISVELRITYGTKDVANSKLKGVFDSEEHSFKGTMVVPNRGLSGEFVFKRDPDFLRFYPAPSTITARKRWEFAAKSILDRVRREAWSLKQILNRMENRRRYMELVPRHYYGKRLTKDEEEELLALFPGLYEADAQFCASLINIHLSKTPIFA
jgi:hypothetical protein